MVEEVLSHPLTWALLGLLIVIVIFCYRGEFQWELNLEALPFTGKLAGKIQRGVGAARRSAGGKSRKDGAAGSTPGAGKRLIRALLALLVCCVSIAGYRVFGDTRFATGCEEAERAAGPQPEPLRHFVIAVDRTTPFSPWHVEQLLKVLDLFPGDIITVVTFSAYGGQTSTQIELVVKLDQPSTAPLPWYERLTGKQQRLQECFYARSARDQEKVYQAVRAAMLRPAPALQRTEIINALRQLGDYLSDSPNDRTKVLLMVSDMIEHAPGGTTSFYERQSLRLINPRQEFDKVRNLVANLRGVQVYIFGGALPSVPSGFRNQNAVAALAEFWRLYVTDSGGQLIEFGTPLPMKAIK